MVANLGAIPMLAIMMGLQHPCSDMSCARPPANEIENAIYFLNANILPFSDSCTNFQSYACGLYGMKCLSKFVKGHKMHFSSHQDRYEHVDHALLDMLKAPQKDVPAIQKAKDLFAKCLNEGEINKSGALTIKKQLETMGFDYSQVTSPHALIENADFLEKFDYVAAWARLLKNPTLFSNFLVFRIEVVEDTGNGQYVPLIVTDPDESTTIQSADNPLVQTLFAHFRPKTRTTQTQTQPPTQPATQIPVTYSSYSGRYPASTSRYRPPQPQYRPQQPPCRPQQPPYSQHTQRQDPFQAASEARSTLWSRVEEITKESTPTPTDGYYRTNLAQLQVSTDAWIADARKKAGRAHNDPKQPNFTINWRRFFDVLFEDVPQAPGVKKNIKEALLTHSAKFVIYLSDVYKFKKMIELLALAQSKTFALSLYLASIMNVLPMGPAELRKQFLRKTESVPKVLGLKREQMCLAIIKDTFRPVVAREVLKNFSEHDEETVRQLVESTKTSFLETVDELKWISDLGKSIIIQQIEAMNIDIPYIHVSRDPENLEDIYEEINDIKSLSFYEAYSQIKRIQRRNTFARIFELQSESPRLEYRPPIDLWSQSEIAKYHHHSNEVEISLAALGHPYYFGSSYLLFPVNLGGLGFHVVRQMAHLFDEIIKKILPFGNSSVLPNEDETKLKERIIAATKMTQRSERVDWSVDGPSWKNSQLEAVADNISLNVCYRTLKDRYWEMVENASPEAGPENDVVEMVLRQPSTTTPDQYFTLALASTMCKQPTPPVTTYLNYSERVNELFRHWQEFAAIWTCSNTSEMVAFKPEEKKMSILSNDENVPA